MKEYKSVKEQLLEYYMAHDHDNWTNTVIKVLSCEDPEIEQAPAQYEDLNILVAIPNPRHQNLNVEIDETFDDNMGTTQAESSAQGASRNPPSGVSYDRPSRPRPPRSHNTTYQSGPAGGSYRSGTGKFQRYNVPEDYAPERKYSVDILDIDCIDSKERRRRIQAWHNSLRLIIATDDKLSDDLELAHILMINKSSRLANELIEGINKDDFMRGSSEDFLQNIVNLLSTVFLGTNYLNDGENQVRIKQEASRERMTKLQICDLCYLDQFTCDYEEALLSVPNTEWVSYIEGYLRKIPYIGKESLEEYQALPPISKLSLIAAKNIVSKKLTKICTDRQMLKRTKKINLCCPEFQGPETMYGCQTIPQIKKWKKKLKKKYRFNKPKKKKYYKNPKRYKKYFGHSNKKKRFFKRRNFKDLKGLNDEPKTLSSSDKQAFCPQKKKTCKCWICQQVGHMSYECPNTQGSKAQSKAFEEIILEEALEQYNLAPLETLDDVSSDEDLYYLETDSDYNSDDYSETSSDITDQE